jgi:hypothetical protein
MRHTHSLALCAALVLGLSAPALAQERVSSELGLIRQLNGTPLLLGTITTTTTKNNHDTAVPFSNTGNALKGMSVLVQCDGAAFLLPGTTNAVTVTAATGVYVEAREKFYMHAFNTYGWIAALSFSGASVACKVWQLI